MGRRKQTEEKDGAEIEALRAYQREKQRQHRQKPQIKTDPTKPAKQPLSSAERMRRYRERQKAKNAEAFYEKERLRMRLHKRKKREIMTEEEKAEERRKDRERRQRLRQFRKLKQAQEQGISEGTVTGDKLGTAKYILLSKNFENKPSVLNFEELECKLEVEDGDFEGQEPDKLTAEELQETTIDNFDDHQYKLEIEILTDEYNFEIENATDFAQDYHAVENESQHEQMQCASTSYRVKLKANDEEFSHINDFQEKLQRQRKLSAERMRKYRARLKAKNLSESDLCAEHLPNFTTNCKQDEFARRARLERYRQKAAERSRRYRARLKEKGQVLLSDGSRIFNELYKAKKADYSRRYRAMKKEKDIAFDNANDDSLKKFELSRKRAAERMRKHRAKLKALDPEGYLAKERQRIKELTMRKKQRLTQNQSQHYETAITKRKQRQNKRNQRYEVATRNRENVIRFEQADLSTCPENEDTWQGTDEPIVDYERIDPLNLLEVTCVKDDSTDMCCW